jgi:FAD/FMN-containing dehydrogenase
MSRTGDFLRRRRWLVAGVIVALIALAVGRPAYLLGRAWLEDRDAVETAERGFADDASRMNRTAVAEIVSIASDARAAETQLRELFARARREHLRVSIAGARHTLGGHTIAPGGIVIDMLPFSAMELDSGARVLHVGAGARWSQVLRYLDARGFSVAIMQSNDDFSVGGSISVNCHGWQMHRPPIAASVVSFRIMKSDGEIVRCSREENRELFSLALGGYGLFGVILDVDLRVVPNEMLSIETTRTDALAYAEEFEKRVERDMEVTLAYGRLCVTPGESFLRDGLLTLFRRDPATGVAHIEDPGLASLRRVIFRAQIDSDAGKELRWTLETRLGEQLADASLSRNQVLSESVAIYAERSADRVDVLHECFVPFAEFAAFLDRARAVLEDHPADLLNVTLRSLETDDDTFLRYADRPMISAVFLFSAERTAAGDRDMETLTRALIDAADACGGRYYLPYRLHASREQFERAYPMARDFFAARRRYDPDLLFENAFSLHYGAP